MGRRSAVAVGVVVFAVAAGAGAQVVTVRNDPGIVPGQPGPQTIASGPGLILGRVVEAGSTRGVAGAVVTLSGPALGRPVDRFDDGLDGGPRRMTTDAQGQFVFYNLPVGSYSLVSTATGYLDGRYGETRLIQIRRTLDIALERTVDVSDNTPRRQVAIQMWQLGGIGGRVTDEHGDPMVGVEVTVIARVPDWGGPVMRLAAFATTDDRGMYHVDVAPGSYVAGVLAATTTMPASSVAAFQHALREGGAALQAFLSGVSATGGLAPRGYGTRVGDFVVNQFGRMNAPIVPPMRDGDGASWFYPSTYHPSTLAATTASPVTVSSGEERGGVDIAMRPAPAVTVSGRVTGPAGPVANVVLALVADDAAVARTSPATLIDTPRALADASGAFAFIGIAPGRYTVRVARAHASPSEPLLWAAQSLTVGEADITDLEVRASTGGRIAGRVVVEGEPAPSAQQIGAIMVAARAVPGSPGSLIAATARAAQAVRVDASGRFTTQEYTPGPYRLIVTNVPSGWVLKSGTAGGRDAVDRNFELASSGVSDVVLTISNRVSSVTGLVRDERGEPAPHAAVVAFPVDRTLWRQAGMSSRRVQTRPPDALGRYTFQALPDGDYYVVAVDWPEADFSDGDVLAALMTAASRVTVSEATPRTQDLRVVVKR